MSSRLYVATFKQLKLAMLTIACMLGLAYLMNYSGMTSTLGLALAGTGGAFPFFSAVVGWLGVFLTGSDTSANALFGNLQVVTANALGLNPILTASVNSAAGVMGKMISVQSIAVAVAATGMTQRRREPAVPLHHQAQRVPDDRDGRDLDAVRLRVPGRGAGGADAVEGQSTLGGRRWAVSKGRELGVAEQLGRPVIVLGSSEPRCGRPASSLVQFRCTAPCYIPRFF